MLRNCYSWSVRSLNLRFKVRKKFSKSLYQVVWIAENQVSVNHYYSYTYFNFIKITKISNITLNFSADSSIEKRYQISHIHSIVYIFIVSSLLTDQWVKRVIFGRGRFENKYSSHIIFWTVPSVNPSTDFHVPHDVNSNVIVCNFCLDVELTFPQTSINTVLGSQLTVFK